MFVNAAFLGHFLNFVHAIRPKRRHLVVSEFINACLEESTLLDEEGKFLKASKSRANEFLKNFYPDAQSRRITELLQDSLKFIVFRYVSLGGGTRSSQDIELHTHRHS